MADEEDLKRLKLGVQDLSRSDLRRANLSNMDLRGRNFSNAHLEGANVSGSDFRDSVFVETKFTQLNAQNTNFRGARIRSPLVAANFGGANLVGADFSAARMINVNFAKADIRSCSFENAHFGEDVIFNEVVFDANTNFDGAEGLRYLSRLPAFENYKYENGKFRRLVDALATSKAADDVNSEAASAVDGSQVIAPDIKQIEEAIGAAPKTIRLISTNLSIAIRQHLALLESNKPNHPDRLIEYEMQVSLLSDVSEGLGEIASALDDGGKISNSESEPPKLTRAARIVSDLSANLESWMKTNGESVICHTMSAGLIGTCSAFFVLCGAPATAAFAVASALVGGKPLVEAAAAFMKSVTGKH